MQTACLYIRVSTDEQAQKGFSQRSQDERLLKYCLLCNVQVTETVFEDFSAKTFNRPQWTRLMAKWRNKRSETPRMVLFTRWDRFSRNVVDAYLMIRKLQKLAIQPQAIEQMLDFNIPEHKIMLAVYLAAAEVENDHISLNISQGIHKAKEEGRWPGRAPIGYSNRTTALGDKYIAPHEPEASIIKKAFEMIATNTLSTHYIYKQAFSKGLKCSRANFWQLIRNPVYCGRVLVPRFGNEKQHIVKGLHEKLISVKLFEEVQNILNARGRYPKPRVTVREQLPLRGFLSCPLCKKTLTGSASMGRYKRYFYYHCSGGCRFRIRADYLDKRFLLVLESLVARNPYVKLYRKIAEDIFLEVSQKRSLNQARISRDIESTMERAIRAKGLLYNGDIDDDDYAVIKESCDRRIRESCRELQKYAALSVETSKYIDESVKLLSCLNELYGSADILGKRELLQLLFPEKIAFDNKHFELIPSEAAHIIYGLRGKFSSFPLENSHIDLPIQKMEEYLKTVGFGDKNSGSINRDKMIHIIHFLRKIALFILKRQ